MIGHFLFDTIGKITNLPDEQINIVVRDVQQYMRVAHVCHLKWNDWKVMTDLEKEIFFQTADREIREHMIYLSVALNDPMKLSIPDDDGQAYCEDYLEQKHQLIVKREQKKEEEKIFQLQQTSEQYAKRSRSTL